MQRAVIGEDAMRIRLEELINSVSALRQLIGQELPAPIAFRLARLIKQVEEVLRDYDAQRLVLLEKYAKREGNNFVFRKEDGAADEEAVRAFLEEHARLIAEEIELPGVRRLSLADLKDIRLTAEHARALGWLVETGDEELETPPE